MKLGFFTQPFHPREKKISQSLKEDYEAAIIADRNGYVEAIFGEHVTDVTNASRTLLMDLETLNWMKDILMTLDIPESSLPEIKPSLYKFGTNSDLLKNVPLTSVLGDQQAALFGQNCINSGDVKNTYGTGCFALMNTGGKPVFSNNKLFFLSKHNNSANQFHGND